MIRVGRVDFYSEFTVSAINEDEDELNSAYFGYGDHMNGLSMVFGGGFKKFKALQLRAANVADDVSLPSVYTDNYYSTKRAAMKDARNWAREIAKELETGKVIVIYIVYGKSMINGEILDEPSEVFSQAELVVTNGRVEIATATQEEPRD